MRLLLLARDYAQSFPNYKRSEDQTLGKGWGKPSVLISYCGEYTLVSNLISSRYLCALNLVQIVTETILAVSMVLNIRMAAASKAQILAVTLSC